MRQALLRLAWYGRFDSRFDSNEKKTIRRSLVIICLDENWNLGWHRCLVHVVDMEQIKQENHTWNHTYESRHEKTKLENAHLSTRFISRLEPDLCRTNHSCHKEIFASHLNFRYAIFSAWATHAGRPVIGHFVMAQERSGVCSGRQGGAPLLITTDITTYSIQRVQALERVVSSQATLWSVVVWLVMPWIFYRDVPRWLNYKLALLGGCYKITYRVA